MSQNENFAIIKSGGKQYKVSPGQQLSVEKLSKKAGEKHVFDQVLMVRDSENVLLGSPTVDSVAVEATVLAEERAAKVIAFKKKRRKGFMKKQGHRQSLTRVSIDSIKVASS